ncbi:telomeric repeat-binding factor 2 isoform X2 [Seriola lalandi dorsalis]|uniref:telomeric repeat-binding factor 2 isoform X2 n=1 Tax=Seriola lalandi dorsalis TaxID=1841481 RepID=UPI000C6FA984|nr:telomeric repeat-binding factor 2 isoform X2 [Seriola lalandi dorsalis]
MAAKETIHSHQTVVEGIVNRWLVDYYLFLALESFKNEQYADFCGIRRVLNSVLARPLESTDTMPTKIGILQFLSRINEGERLDLLFESDQSITPLESALMLLEGINQKCSIPEQDFENVSTSIKEMIVRILIKYNEFEKAKELLIKYFPKPMVGKKAIFMGLISKRSKRHELIERIDFHQFKEEMLAFCQRLCSFSVPFLHKAAKQLIDKRLTEQDDKIAGPDEQDEPGASPQIITVSFLPCKRKIIQRTRLEEVYKALAAGSDERTFAWLEEEVEKEQQARKEDLSLRLSPSPEKDANQDELFQRESGSPMEASPADQPPQMDAVPQTQAGSLSKTPSVLRKRRLYTVAQLVVEPDSQASLQCSTASQELETEFRTEEPPQSPTLSKEKDSLSLLTDIEVTKPTRKLRRRPNKSCSRASASLAESTDSEEDPPGSVANREIHVGKLHNQSNSSPTRNSTQSKQLSSDNEEDPQGSLASFRTPVRKTRKQLASKPLSNPGSAVGVCVMDSSLDKSPNLSTPHPVPQTSSTPHKDSTQDKGLSHSKWKQLYNNAKESKESWSDEESYVNSRKNSGNISLHICFNLILSKSSWENLVHAVILFVFPKGSHETNSSTSSHRKRRWTESETQKLKEGVRKFGEGNWGKIKAHYKFSNRTNVNLKDRWRTMKKSNMV